jgi:acylphosphatase
MVNWARKGPIWAKIEALNITWEDYTGEFKDFEIRYDL